MVLETLKNKKILITGGNSGLGYELAKLLNLEKAKVTILGRNEDEVHNVSEELNVENIIADLSIPNQVSLLKQKLQDMDIDILINNAGIIFYGLLEEHTIQKVNDLLYTNLTSAILLSSFVLPSLKRKNYGSIVNIISSSGINKRANETVYAATKWGLNGFTYSLQEEVKATNIRIISINPGAMYTPLFDKAGQAKPAGSYMKPEDVAKIIVFSLKQPQSIKMDQVTINRNKNS